MFKLIKWTLTTFITFIIVYCTISVITSDNFMSVTPGWHTTIYPSQIRITILSLLLLICAGVISWLFRTIYKYISNFAIRLKAKNEI
ncbi:hypothetical protein B0O44_104239 [Pedobacter nutrimenti]|uniref:Uncharacterized protein n=1 Tax=Pedobacter nutrimenti TaxID=1241337 RepID=A0A318UGE6_9SPHI|nr:hypothetical protein B0O44_104239 [Pedobacter nutrimenti]